MSIEPDVTSRVTLRPITIEDGERFIELATASVDLHHPWVDLPVTPEEFRAYVKRFDQVTGVGFLIHRRDSGAIAGFVNISQIMRASYQRGVLGFAAFSPHAGYGFMSEGVSLAVRYAFERLDLHRLEAEIQPDNAPSLKLVERLGFRREGYSPGYIRIGGIWRDHERWAVTADVAKSSRVSD